MYKTREEVKKWLNQMGIENYVINEDLTVDVNKSIDISKSNLNNIPIKFGVVNGSFYCYKNKLTSLDFFPKEINGDCIFFDNNEIKEDELVNFNCDITNVHNIFSDFSKNGSKEEFLEKVNYQKIKKENELLKELSINNIIKLNNKL